MITVEVDVRVRGTDAPQVARALAQAYLSHEPLAVSINLPGLGDFANAKIVGITLPEQSMYSEDDVEFKMVLLRR